MRLVFLAAPDQLDRRVGECLGDLDRLVDIILRAAAPAEAAAEVVSMDFAFVERDAGGFGQGRQRGLEVLRRHPGFGPVGRELDRAVHQLHRRVGEEGRRVDRLDFLGGFVDRLQRVAVLAARHWWWSAVRPSLSMSAIVALDCEPFGPSSQTIGSASSAFLARHQVSATTATAVSLTRTTFFTPGMPAILLSS